MQVFLAFFGITRSLRFTAAGIERNVVAPLRRAGMRPRRFGHVHLPAVIDNPRSHERACPVEPDEAGLLGCERLLAEPQDPALIETQFAYCASFPDHFGDAYSSVRNLCFQLRSLSRLWALLEPEIGRDECVLFLRPDLDYLDPLDLPATMAALDAARADWAVPGWHAWGGLNDRFALCRGRAAAAAYALRGALLYDAAALHDGLHGERLLAHAARHHGISVAELAMRAVRIRADGRPAPQDVQAFFAVEA